MNITIYINLNNKHVLVVVFYCILCFYLIMYINIFVFVVIH